MACACSVVETEKLKGADSIYYSGKTVIQENQGICLYVEICSRNLQKIFLNIHNMDFRRKPGNKS